MFQKYIKIETLHTFIYLYRVFIILLVINHKSIIMKNIFLSFLVALFSISINAQEVFMLSPIIVADEDIESFEMIQKN